MPVDGAGLSWARVRVLELPHTWMPASTATAKINFFTMSISSSSRCRVFADVRWSAMNCARRFAIDPDFINTSPSNSLPYPVALELPNAGRI